MVKAGAVLLALAVLLGAGIVLLRDGDDAPAPASPAQDVVPVASAVPATAGRSLPPAAAILPPPGAHAQPAPVAEDPAALAQVGRAQLQLGIDAKKDGHPEQARGLLEDAAAALAKSIALSGDRVDPWTLQGMAQAQLELGSDIEAITWADRALQQLRLGSNDDYTAFRAAQLTMSVGIVYFRAGQKQTGIAYMDQAISMAPTPFDREDFADLKEETIGS